MLAIELNEIHTTVSRSFVRPRATSPSLPFPSFSFPACLACRASLESVEHQGDENTRHILCMQQLGAGKGARCKQADVVLRSFLLWQPSHRPGYYCFNQAEGGVEAQGWGYICFSPWRARRSEEARKLSHVLKKSSEHPGKGLLKVQCQIFSASYLTKGLLTKIISLWIFLCIYIL